MELATDNSALATTTTVETVSDTAPTALATSTTTPTVIASAPVATETRSTAAQFIFSHERFTAVDEESQASEDSADSYLNSEVDIILDKNPGTSNRVIGSKNNLYYPILVFHVS